MSKHTPGPWVFYDDSNDGKTNRIEIVATGKTVARIYNSVPAEDLPNARLIAAAPELLDTLTQGAQMNMPDFLEWVAARLVNVHGEDPNVDYVQTLRHRAKLCREAIAKATGDGA